MNKKRELLNEKVKFKAWLRDLFYENFNQAPEKATYNTFDDFYAILGYDYELEDQLQRFNINCTSDLQDLFTTKTKNVNKIVLELFDSLFEGSSFIDNDFRIKIKKSIKKKNPYLLESISKCILENQNKYSNINFSFTDIKHIFYTYMFNEIISKEYICNMRWDEKYCNYIIEALYAFLSAYQTDNCLLSLSISDIINIIGEGNGDNLLGIYDEKYFNSYIVTFHNCCYFSEIPNGTVFLGNYYKTKDGNFVIDIQL